MSVAVPVPHLDPLTYNVPDSYPELPPIGARVRVPVGARTAIGCVVGHEATLDAGTAPRDVAGVLDAEPFLPQAIVDLCGWVADYYVAGFGDAIGAAMPPGSRRTAAFKTRRMVAATPDGLSAVGASSSQPGLTLTAGQRDVLEILAAAPAGLPVATLRERGASADVVRRLGARGLVVWRAERRRAGPVRGRGMHGRCARP